ncbi:MAG TPA: sulfite exporter TauE/SafE family protein [Gaiellaceae bacterium]|nr:sulfite exporter TauE/SafE family protein [Gaiellaceae bacterium]
MAASTIARLAGIGVAAGFFGALFGVGGGVIIVPLLVFLCSFDQRRASATSLTAILVSSVAGSVTYALHGDLKPGAAAAIGLPAVLGVLVGTSLQQRVPVDKLSYGFAVLLLAVAVRLFV